jgi:hypothetical protein
MNLLYFIVGVTNIIKNGDLILNKFNYAGCDCRYPLNSSEDLLLILLKERHYKMEFMKTLQSPNLSNFDKMSRIEKSEFFENKMKPNITSGGLFNDWNFEIEL